ncbi:hypothetical protein BZY95_03570 [Billgrantia desiderata SP1]|nr:hypothetical protein BZY95_03570 [Halomonas desiderata SP1]
MGATTLATISRRLARYLAIAVVGTLHPDIGTPRIGLNTPAKPMWTPVLTLKLRGFFIALMQGSSHLVPAVAR